MVFGDNLKTTILKTIEAFGKGASSLAEGAQQKLNEMNLEVRRRELADKIPGMVMELYRSGAELPDTLKEVLDELSRVEEKLSALRPAKTQPEPVQADAAEASEEADEPAEEPVPDVAPAAETAEAAAEPAELEESPENN